MEQKIPGTSRREEEEYLQETLHVIRRNVETYEADVIRMQAEIDEMLDHYHDNDAEIYTALSNTVTMRDNMKHALLKNEKAEKKPYFGRIVFWDEGLGKEESLYIGRGGIARDTTHQMVVDWRAPVANAYYENGLGRCSYPSPQGKELPIDLKLKRTYEIENQKLLDYFDTEVIANDDLLTKYLAKNKQAVLGEIIATIQKEQNEIIRKSPYHNMIVQGVAGSGKTTVAMHRISYILYNYQERFRPEDFYIVGSNRILLEYITGVLPDLDVYGIRQMTMEQLFVRLLYEDWDDKVYTVTENTQHNKSGWIRGTYAWFRELEAYCGRIERDAISTETILLNRKQFVEGLKDGIAGVYDETGAKDPEPGDLIEILAGADIEDYVREMTKMSVQSKINMLNERLLVKVNDEFLKNRVRYTEKERKAILKAYRGRFGKNVWKISIFQMYREFLMEQREKGYEITIPEKEFDVYDLAALSYLYKRIKETEVISEAHHVVIDEAQDYGMMAYAVLEFCMKDCTYTVMGDVSQNIHFGYGLNDWEELKALLLHTDRAHFGVLKKSYRNTVEISNFAMDILHHGQFASYPAEPIIRHGKQVAVRECKRQELLREAAAICEAWQKQGLGTIVVVCRTLEKAEQTAKELGKRIPVVESSIEKAVFSDGIMVLPVAYTKGLEFDAVLILDPDREEYPVDDGHAKLLYVAATRALHELCVLHTGHLTGLVADPVPIRQITQAPGLVEPQHTKSGCGFREQKKQADDLKLTPHPPYKKPAAVLKKAKPLAEPPSKTVLLTGVAPLIPKRAGRTETSTAVGSGVPSFGDMPENEKLRPAGHGKIDLSIKWVYRQADGLYLQSRYGVLRLSPVKSDVIRVTFVREGEPVKKPHPKIRAVEVERAWMYRETSSLVELTTDKLCLRIDKQTGAIIYRNRNKEILLEEKHSECRQIETAGKVRSWVFFDWKKSERLSVPGTKEKKGLSLNGSARYIQPDTSENALPYLISDRGYGLLAATDSPVICCNIPAYGSYLCVEGEKQIDFYFSLIPSSNSIFVS